MNKRWLTAVVLGLLLATVTYTAIRRIGNGSVVFRQLNSANCSLEVLTADEEGSLCWDTAGEKFLQWNGTDWADLVSFVSIDVRAYGALCNGTTDDSAAFQAAIDDAEAMGGAVVVFPAGNCDIDTGLVIDSPNVTLQGQGSIDDSTGTTAVTTLQCDDSICIDIRADSTTIRDMVIDEDPGGSADYGININNLSGGVAVFKTRIINVGVTDVNVQAIRSFESEQLLIEDCVIEGAGDAAVWMSGATTTDFNNRIVNTRIDNCGGATSGAAIYMQSQTSPRVDSVQIYNTNAGRKAIYALACNEPLFINNTVSGDSTADGFYINRGENVVLIGNFVDDVLVGYDFVGNGSVQIHGVTSIGNKSSGTVTTGFRTDQYTYGLSVISSRMNAATTAWSINGHTMTDALLETWTQRVQMETYTTEPSCAAGVVGTIVYVDPSPGNPYFTACMPAGSGTFDWVDFATGVE